MEATGPTAAATLLAKTNAAPAMNRRGAAQTVRPYSAQNQATELPNICVSPQTANVSDITACAATPARAGYSRRTATHAANRGASDAATTSKRPAPPPTQI